MYIAFNSRLLGRVQSDKEQQDWKRTNVECSAFPAFVELLNIEIENSVAASTAMRKLAVSLADLIDLRIILSVLYIIADVMREESKQLDVEVFKEELMNPCEDELLIVKLLEMVTNFAAGGMEDLRELKRLYREEAGLDNLQEDTIEVAKAMRPTSPPTSATALLDNQNSKKNNRPFRRSLMKQSSLDEPNLEYELGRGLLTRNKGGIDSGEGDVDEGVFVTGQIGQRPYDYYYYNPNNIQEPRPDTPLPIKAIGLSWVPKVGQKDVNMFLDVSRMKFVGYKLQGNRECLAGLPQPIHEGLSTLKRHIYTSLAEIQI